MTKGTYFGGTIGSPWGLGGGLYIDNHGRLYPQGYFGSPGLSFSAGYTPNLEGFLTGPSASGSLGAGSIKANFGTSGTSPSIGIGTPGVGATYGIGPYEITDEGWTPDAAGEANGDIYNTGFSLPTAQRVTARPSKSARMRQTPTYGPAAVNDDTSSADGSGDRAASPSKPGRYLGRRVAGASETSPFDNGAPAMPFVVGNNPFPPVPPASFNDAFQVPPLAPSGPDQPLWQPRVDGAAQASPNNIRVLSGRFIVPNGGAVSAQAAGLPNFSTTQGGWRPAPADRLAVPDYPVPPPPVYGLPDPSADNMDDWFDRWIKPLFQQ